MSSRFGSSVLYATISSGFAVSDPIAIANVNNLSVIAPTVTSCQAFVQLSPETTSASFTRTWDVDGRSHFVWSLGAGPGAVDVSRIVAASRFARIETSVNQTDTRTLTLMAHHLP